MLAPSVESIALTLQTNAVLKASDEKVVANGIAPPEKD